ncbi:MAG: nicotinamide mononucleotide deamidase-related protein [Candidatus Bathyarchaeota archaeon]|nr:nicotinamide mononucleotide deamidase-related protein [Candidatus Bathyarchaeota archaeon]MDH5495329.1 nicotinamide mononucleotide deamidase-related protein [Candidatus Bathyarchaeota archaeon]
MAKCVEMVSVGNELLIGKTLNTNAKWLAKRITSLGLSVSRITVIGDDVKEIVKALREAVHRSPDFIITTGGLGPTFDDKTLVGIAEAFGFKLQVNKKALKMVEEKYVAYAEGMGHEKFELTPARVKMAKIPEGAEPLPNPVGTAPAITIRNNKVIVFALPGVPSEMKAIFENSLSPVLKAASGNLTFFETSLYVSGVMESEMAPLIDQVMHDNPYVYIKSHPMGAEEKPRIELHLSTTAEDAETAKKRVCRALIQLSEVVKAKGGKTKTAKAETR